MWSHPADYLRLLVHKAHLFMHGDEILRNQEIYAFRSYSGVLKVLLWKLQIPRGPGLAFPFGLLLPLAWPGCLIVLRKRHVHGALLWAFTIAYGLSVIAFFVTARYRLPVVVPLVLLTAAFDHVSSPDGLARSLINIQPSIALNLLKAQPHRYRDKAAHGAERTASAAHQALTRCPSHSVKQNRTATPLAPLLEGAGPALGPPRYKAFQPTGRANRTKARLS